MRTPTIVCLCGSTKFKDAFEKVNLEETMKGKIVLSVGCFSHANNIQLTEEEKAKLDELHLRKIDLSDEVIILNINGYVGKSLKVELQYALSNNKQIRFLEPIIKGG